MGAEAALVATLDVKLNKLEQQMRQAGVLADKGVRDIEDRFARSNPTLGTAAGVGIANFLAAAGREAIKFLTDFNDRLKAIDATAKVTGESVNAIFALQQAAGKQGVAPEAINQGLEGLGKNLNDVYRQANGLSELFEANGEKIKNSAGQVIPLQQALGVVAELVKNARTEFDKIEIVRLAGLSRDWVRILEGGATEFYRTQSAAQATAPDVQKLVDKAKEFDEALKAVSSTVTTGLKAAFNDFFSQVGKGWDVLINRLENSGFGEYARQLSALQADQRAAAAPYPDESTRYKGKDAGAFVADVVVKPRSRQTVIPTKASGGSSDGLDAFEREQRRIEERTAALQKEVELVGKTAEERARVLETLRLEQMAQREGIDLTDEQKTKIAEQAAAYGKVVEALEQAQQKQRQFVELQNFAGNLLVDTLDRAIAGGEKFSDVMADVARSLAKAALQAAIMGSGPLAGLFGTGGQNGNVGGLLGGLFKAFGGGDFSGYQNATYATGGYTGSGGKYEPAGIVHKGEYVLDAATVRRLGVDNLDRLRGYAEGGFVGAGLSTVRVPSLAPAANSNISVSIGGAAIDARGSTMSPGEFQAILSKNNEAQAKAIKAALPAMVQDARSRGAIR